MKKIIVTVAALALLGGSAAGAYIFFVKPAQAATTTEVKESKKEDKAKSAEAEAAVSFVQMSPLVLPIVDKNGVSQVVSIVISLEVKDALLAKEVERFTPRLKDAYIQDMYGVLTRQAAMEGGVIQVGYIKNRLSKITAKVLGVDKVNDVLLQVVQQRPV